MAEELKYGFGCNPSVMDGTEYEVNVDEKIELPKKLDWSGMMLPIFDLGLSSTCVCQSLTKLLDYMVNCENETPNKTNGFDINKLYSIRANKNVDGMTFKEALRYVHHNEFNGVKINGYAKISSVLQAKYALLNGPIIGGFPVYNTDAYFFIRRGCERMQGGHAVTIVGYDDDKREFKIQNSWGTRWGKNGYTTLKYDEFPEVCFEAWCILP